MAPRFIVGVFKEHDAVSVLELSNNSGKDVRLFQFTGTAEELKKLVTESPGVTLGEPDGLLKPASKALEWPGKWCKIVAFESTPTVSKWPTVAVDTIWAQVHVADNHFLERGSKNIFAECPGFTKKLYAVQLIHKCTLLLWLHSWCMDSLSSAKKHTSDVHLS
jgi:hypothetical protein